MKSARIVRLVFVLSGALMGANLHARAELGWIMRPGNPADCKSTPVKAWPGNWLALKQAADRWSVVPTKVSIVHGDYRSSEPADYLIQANWPVTSGSVPSAPISRRGDDFLFDFHGVKYEWIQAAGARYYVTDGTSFWNGAWLKMPRATSPAVSKSNETHRCGYGTGCHELLWVGDINRDGNPDFIVWFNEGEDEGLQLWLGRQNDSGLYFQTAARGLYLYNRSFSCVFRNPQ